MQRLKVGWDEIRDWVKKQWRNDNSESDGVEFCAAVMMANKSLFDNLAEFLSWRTAATAIKLEVEDIEDAQRQLSQDSDHVWCGDSMIGGLSNYKNVTTGMNDSKLRCFREIQQNATIRCV